MKIICHQHLFVIFLPNYLGLGQAAFLTKFLRKTLFVYSVMVTGANFVKQAYFVHLGPS